MALDQHIDLSGEWIVGGFEAKGIAYALNFLAIGNVLRGLWFRSLISVGVATSFHPLVGGWTGIGIAFVWLAVPEGRAPLRTMVGGGLVALVLAAPGLIPALGLNSGQSPEVIAEAARIYVFERLPQSSCFAHDKSGKVDPFAARARLGNRRIRHSLDRLACDPRSGGGRAALAFGVWRHSRSVACWLPAAGLPGRSCLTTTRNSRRGCCGITCTG